MNKGIIFLSAAALILTTGIASADMTFNTKSPMYNTSFGTGIGTFSATHNVGAGVDSAQAVQATAEEWAGRDKESKVTIKDSSSSESKFVPASNLGGGEGYSYEKGSDGYIYGYADGGEQGVNEEKTMYTDGIGRLHFFGKGSRTRTRD